MSTRIEGLQDAIELGHNCRAEHIRSVPLVERLGEQTVWEGVVEVFELVGHAQAKCCFAWSYEKDGIRHSVAVLQLPPVTSPNTAIRAAVASGQQK